MRVRFHPRRRPSLSDRGPAKLVFQTCGSRTLPEAKEGADGNKEVGGKSVGPRCDVCSVIRGLLRNPSRRHATSGIGLKRTPSLASDSYRVRFESCFLGKDAKVEGDPKAALGESSEPYVTA